MKRAFKTVLLLLSMITVLAPLASAAQDRAGIKKLGPLDEIPLGDNGTGTWPSK